MSGREEFAGRLTERVTLWRPAPDRDALGGWTGGWAAIGMIWAAVEPLVSETTVQAGPPRWRLTLRTRALFAGDRIAWGTATLRVRAVRRDPALPDRIIVIAQEDQ